MNAAHTAKFLAWLEKHKDVMKAFAQGEQVEVSNTLSGGKWVDTPNPLWDGRSDYRIKPQPRTRYVIEESHINGASWREVCSPSSCVTKCDFDATVKGWNSNSTCYQYRVVEYKEVL